MTSELGQPGQIIDGKYRIVRLLGAGGMGAVFEGENIRIRRKVAIKMLHGDVSTQPDVIARFEREAQAAALVGSEHICEVLDLGMLPDQTRYMVMEYLEGDTLSGLIKKWGRLKPAQSIPILTQILDALGAAHAAGIIHRDLKPDNVFILPQKSGMQNFVKILDFGVSKFSQLSGEAMNVTRVGAVVGTPYYMSPEQARGSSAIDQRTDIYAIGVLLYQATTGQVPYQAETFNELLFKIVLEVAPLPQVYVPDIDPEFAAIILRAMAREPDQRFQSCQQFRETLVQFQSSRANPLPAFNLPRYHEDPAPLRTEVIDLSAVQGGPAALGNRSVAGGSSPSGAGWPAAGANRPAAGSYPSGASWPAAGASPSGASWPAAGGASSPASPGGGSPSGASWPAAQPASEGTMPMQPGLPFAGSGAGNVSPMQSGAGWANASNAGAIPVGPGGPSATANSWGNASSPNAAAKPKSGNGLLLGVVGVAALVGVVGAIVAFMVMGKPGKGSAGQPTAAPTLEAVPTATAAPTATATAAATAAPTASDTAQPGGPPGAPADSTTAATATATAAPADSSKAAVPGKAPGPMPTGPAVVKPGGKPGGAGTGKPGGGKPGGKPGTGDLGY